MSSNPPKNPRVLVVELVRTELLVRGSGTADDPTRVIEQFWTSDGKFVAENDPYDPSKRALKKIEAWLGERAYDTELPPHKLVETMISAVESMQTVIDKQRETILKLQEQIQPTTTGAAEETPDSKCAKSKTKP